MIYLWAFLLFLSNALAWASNFFGVPGNWLLVIFSVVYKLVLPIETVPDLSWTMIFLLIVLATFGEVWEFAAGAFGAAKQGASRRGAIMSIVGSLIGSIVGATVGIPIPVVGPLIGALLGGGIGAFAGAYFGEQGRSHRDRMQIGKGALIGKYLGIAGKLIFGLIMLVIATVDSFANF
ncbi:DUF456 domain-containing protein [Planctomicrobium sp. SH668]|uniref:DUF456 domain-containing protein n=1 Tax=Planctomicrobium sp. SH668 TaxID=3448126 RepID=UPI003F5AEA2F